MLLGRGPGDGPGVATARPSFQPGLWVSLIDHPEAIATGLIVHGENTFKGPHMSTVLPTHSVDNVFIRNSGTFETDRA